MEPRHHCGYSHTCIQKALARQSFLHTLADLNKLCNQANPQSSAFTVAASLPHTAQVPKHPAAEQQNNIYICVCVFVSASGRFPLFIGLNQGLASCSLRRASSESGDTSQVLYRLPHIPITVLNFAWSRKQNMDLADNLHFLCSSKQHKLKS